MLQRDVFDSTWERNKNRTASISDCGYRLMAWLNRSPYQGKKSKKKKKSSTLLPEKTKDLCKALMHKKRKRKEIETTADNNTK